MTPGEVIQLFQDPKKLLRRCYLHIAGGATRSPSLPNAAPPPANGQAEVATFKVEIGGTSAFEKTKGFTTGLSGLIGREKERVFVKITKQPGLAKDEQALDDDEFNAYYIPMVQTSDVKQGASHYMLPGHGALDLMLTSKLSGCMFGVGSDANGAKLVTHVQPKASIVNDDERQGHVKTRVDQGFVSVKGRFRKGHEYTDLAAVIGRRTGTKWKFYLQASTLHGGDEPYYAISKVEVIR